MTVAIIGSRGLEITDFGKYLPKETTTIVSGGAKGIDSCAKKYADENGISCIEILPKYDMYGRAAPLKRNLEIIDAADIVLAFWDGLSRGTKYVIDNCRKINKKVVVIEIEK